MVALVVVFAVATVATYSITGLGSSRDGAGVEPFALAQCV